MYTRYASLPCALALADACAFAFEPPYPPYPLAWASALAEAEAKPPPLFADAWAEAEEYPPPIPMGPKFTFPPNAWALLLAWALPSLGLNTPNGSSNLPTFAPIKSPNTPSQINIIRLLKVLNDNVIYGFFVCFVISSLSSINSFINLLDIS